MKILFLTRKTWYSEIMGNYILKNFPTSKIIDKPVNKVDKKYDFIISIGYQKIISDQILSKAKIKYVCCCGSVIRKSDKTKHDKTKKHINFINST